jgi:hypothetical protein
MTKREAGAAMGCKKLNLATASEASDVHIRLAQLVSCLLGNVSELQPEGPQESGEKERKTGKKTLLG